MPAPAVVTNFLIADVVLQDRMTGKWSVIGIFDKIYAGDFPCVHPSLALYVRFSGAEGRYRVKVEFRDEDGKVVSAFERIEFEAKDPLHGGDFGITTHGLPLKQPGRYQFRLYLNEQFSVSTSLDVYRLEKPPVPPAAPPPA